MVEDGFVTEGTSSSAYIIKDGVIITRPLSNAILPGIRRKVLMNLTKEHGIKVEERLFSLKEALTADEAFMSSATVFILPIVEIDSKVIGDGKPWKYHTKKPVLCMLKQRSKRHLHLKSKALSLKPFFALKEPHHESVVYACESMVFVYTNLLFGLEAPRIPPLLVAPNAKIPVQLNALHVETEVIGAIATCILP